MDLHCGKDAFEKSVLRKNEITIRPMLAIQRPGLLPRTLPLEHSASLSLSVSRRRWRGDY
jgi:hypothetical protein